METLACVDKPKLEMNLPLVSVIIRTNVQRKGCLAEAIDSVLKQTYQYIELVIVENGSEELEDWLSRYEIENGSRIISYYHSAFFDRCAAGNIGLAEAKGEYLCFLDDDDLFYPEHIQFLVSELEARKDVAAAYSLAEEIPSEISSYTPFIHEDGTKKLSFQRTFSRGALFVNNNLAIQCVLFRKSLFVKHGGFDPELERLEDWNLWVRYASKDDFIFVNHVGSMYRTPFSIHEILLRDKMLDRYYSRAREKQKDVVVEIDEKLITEILAEIFRVTKITSLVFSKFSKSMVINSYTFKQSFSKHKVNQQQKYTSNVLEAIKLANQIVLEKKLLWMMHRTETTLKKLLHLSLFKRLWFRS
ncbi:MAG: glycosyltransferase [Gammaproteobacteria bacterium]